MRELIFKAVQESDGGYCAECLTEDIFTEADTWEQLRANVVEAISAYFFDRPRPERVRLRLVRDMCDALRLTPMGLGRQRDEDIK